MIKYENIIDNYLLNSIDILYTDTVSKISKDTLIELYNFEDYDELEEELLGLISETNVDESSMSESINIRIVEFGTLCLFNMGIKLLSNDLKTVLSILTTIKEVQNLSHQIALELSVIINDDEIDDEYIFSKIVEYYTSIDYLDLYTSIEYISPSVIKDLITVIDTAVENVYENIDTVDDNLTSSYIYNTYIKDPNIKLPYEALIDKLIIYTNITSDVNKLANEIAIVVNFSKNIENNLYFLQTNVKEDLEEVYLETDKEQIIKDALSIAANKIKG